MTLTNNDLDAIFEYIDVSEDLEEYPHTILSDMRLVYTGKMKINYGPLKKGEQIIINRDLDDGNIELFDSDEKRSVKFIPTYTVQYNEHNVQQKMDNVQQNMDTDESDNNASEIDEPENNESDINELENEKSESNEPDNHEIEEIESECSDN